jgi:hypothetical protein
MGLFEISQDCPDFDSEPMVGERARQGWLRNLPAGGDAGHRLLDKLGRISAPVKQRMHKLYLCRGQEPDMEPRAVSLKKITAFIAAGAIVVGSLLTPAIASASAGPVPSRHVVVLEPCVKGGNIGVCWKVRRKHFQLTEGPAEWIARIRWSHWNGHSARGTGRLWEADEHRVRLGHVTVVLSRPRGRQLIAGHRHPHFTRLHLIGGRDTVHHWSWESQFGEWQATVQQAAFAEIRSTVAYGVPDGNVSGSNFRHGRVAPEGRLIWTGDGSAYISHMRWQSWSRYSARGTGKMHVRVFPGFTYKTEHTRLHFHRVRRHDGQRYFTRLHFHLRHHLLMLHSGTLHFARMGTPAWFPL